MISNKLIKSYDFTTIDEYFDYVVMSYLNGNFSQLKELIRKMSKGDKREFMNYLNNCGESHNTQDTILKYVIS